MFEDSFHFSPTTTCDAPDRLRRAKQTGGPRWDEVHALALRVARARTREETAAEEVAQEALLRLWRRRERLAEVDSWEAWTVRVTLNEVLRHAERRDRRQDRELTVSEYDVTVPAGHGNSTLCVEDTVWVRGALATLPAIDRRIIVLHYFADMPLPCVAEDLGVPLGTVKARVHRARKRLREELVSL